VTQPGPSDSSITPVPPVDLSSDSSSLVADAIKAVEREDSLSESSIKLYVAAIVDLWKQQSQQGINAFPNPREGPARALLQTLRIKQVKEHKATYADRGPGTYLDGISQEEQLVKLANDGLNRVSHNFVGIRDRLMMMLSHSCLFRGDEARRLELADLHSLVLDSDSRFSRCVALIVTLCNGKTNQDGQLQMAGVLRHKNVEQCTVGALALHLFCKFHMGTTPLIDDKQPKHAQFPDFTSNETWYDIKLFPSPESARTSINYGTQNKAYKEAYKRIGIVSTKTTHLMRATGARMAELGGATEDDIMRSGRWNQSTMVNCYLSKLPRGTVRTLAGFKVDGRDYHTLRIVPLPDTILNMVFSWMPSTTTTMIPFDSVCVRFPARPYPCHSDCPVEPILITTSSNTRSLRAMHSTPSPTQ